LVPEREIIPVDMGVEEAMKLIVSGGFYSPPDKPPSDKPSSMEIARKRDRMTLKDAPKVQTQ
jgi:uncharacterized membrane protein